MFVVSETYFESVKWRLIMIHAYLYGVLYG